MMLEFANEVSAGLRVLEGANRPDATSWSGALAEFFDVGGRVLHRLQADIRLERFRPQAFLLGEAADHGLSGALRRLLADIDHEYPIELESPFEGTDSIAGGLWSGRKLFGPSHDDALAKLRFEQGTLDLPLHVHEFSDRFIAVLEGGGVFHWSSETLESFVGTNIRSVAVRTGDVLVFTRGLLHTFSAPHDVLTLLSYHSPEIPFDDTRQYTIPPLRWTPRLAVAT
jgi:mannose-6-phosphate isomerase-like protein (cupin superfamily)